MLTYAQVVPDEVEEIEKALRNMIAAGCALVCTTGGTGPALRDVTPEAMAKVCDKSYICSRMLTYAHVCSRMLTYADVC
jgi:molybdopterin biosynthesis enzyme MoaB